MTSSPMLTLPSPEGETLCQELWTQWLQLYQQLYQKAPRAHRQLDVVYLTYFMELNDDEIAERFGVSRQQVQVLRARGMEQLRNDANLRQSTQEIIENCF